MEALGTRVEAWRTRVEALRTRVEAWRTRMPEVVRSSAVRTTSTTSHTHTRECFSFFQQMDTKEEISAFSGL